MKIIVTGGAGFIGSAVVRHLLGHTDHEVLVVDKLTYAGNLTSLDAVRGHPHYQFSRADICDRSAMAHIFSNFGPDAMMHLAAESHVDRSIDGPADFINTNVVGTYVLLETALPIGESLASAPTGSAFITSQPMRSSERFRMRGNLPKRPATIRARLIRPVRPHLTTSYGLGVTPMGCRY